MLLRLEHAIQTTIIPIAKKQLVTVQTLTAKVLTAALRILKALRDFLLSMPQRIFNRNIQLKPSIPITSFPNQNGMALDQDLLSLALTYVANPKLESVSKGVAKASLQSYRLIFEDLGKEQEGFLSLLVKQTIMDYPIKDEAVEEVFKKRLKQVYFTIMANAKNWPGHTEIFAETKPYGPLNSQRLREIAQWTTDQHLIFIFKRLVEHTSPLSKPLSILNSTLSIKEKACAMRKWLIKHPHAFDARRSLTLWCPNHSTKLTEIPEEISYLKNLQELDFFSHAIQFLPNSLGQLENLQRLNLSNNQIKILPDFIGQLKKLQKLFLSENQLQWLPDTIKQLTELQELSISGNQFKILPNSITYLRKLQRLLLSINQLDELPKMIKQLEQLEELDVLLNKLRKLPNSIGKLKDLRKFFACNNQLGSSLNSIGQLTQLRQFVLTNNHLQRLPNSVEQLTNLQELDLRGNPLKEFPDYLKKLIRARKVLYDTALKKIFTLIFGEI